VSVADASRLRRLIAERPGDPPRREPAAAIEGERCDLCGEPIPPEHRHLLDLERRELACGCRACTLLFDSPVAGRRFRLVPDRYLALADFDLDDAAWQSLRLPVDLAFFFESTAVERVAAFYPGPMGATESLLELAAWTELLERNPILADLAPDVEALLVNRAGDAREHFIVPVDVPYRLVGLIRTHWRGLSGGDEVWREIEHFFEGLRGRARTFAAAGRE
jgi:Family of unknown function (DUF5947)